MENLREHWFGVDSQGNLNVFFDETWENVTTTIRGKRHEITGSNLNTLLKGIIMLFGHPRLNDKLFEGGLYAWEEIIEPAFISLPHLCIEEITARLIYLQRACLLNENVAAASLIFEGTITFLYFWLVHFKFYLHESSYILLLSVVAPVVSQMSRIEKLNLSSTVLERLEQLKSCYFVQKANPQCHMHMFPYRQPMHHRLVEPNIPFIEGKWNGKVLIEQKEQLKAKMASLPQIKLEIFGADMLVDNMSDDDEDFNTGFAGTKTDEQTIVCPMSRISTGFSLLQSPFSLAKNILDLDIVEIARQWTMSDYYLFRELSLHSLVSSCYSTNKGNSKPRLLESIKYGGIKKLVDRFNASSIWISTQIMLGRTSLHRAHLISKFIELAKEFLKLRNFHGLMSVLTALQQGSVTRLYISFDLVPTADQLQLNDLKRLMAGGKNYANYREELLRLMNQLEENQNANTVNDWKIDIDRRKFGESSFSRDSLTRNAEGTVISLSASGGNGIIPHLAAHVAALTAITECHTDYLPDCAHLFNVTKWKLCHQIVKPIERLQQLEYTYAPVRVIIAALHHAWKTTIIPQDELKGRKSSKNLAKDLFILSELIESNEMISKYKIEKTQNPAPKATSSRDNYSVASSGSFDSKGKQSSTDGNKKFQRSNAYDRIRSSSVSRSSQNSNRSSEQSEDHRNSGENSESDEDNSTDGSSKLPKKTFVKKLLNIGGFMRGKRSTSNSVDESDEEEEEVSDDSKDGTSSSDGDEKESDEEESVEKGSKKPKLLKNIIRAFSFR